MTQKYTIDLTNIKYCDLTIIYNNDNIFNKIERFFTWEDEKISNSYDSIILELDDEIIEIKKNCIINENIICERFKSLSYIFPRSIKKKIDNNHMYYLTWINPELVSKSNDSIQKLFTNYKNINNIKFEKSYYDSNYENNNKVSFAIKKTKSNNIFSKYIIAYDSENLENNDIINIVNKIFCL